MVDGAASSQRMISFTSAYRRGLVISWPKMTRKQPASRCGTARQHGKSEHFPVVTASISMASDEKFSEEHRLAVDSIARWLRCLAEKASMLETSKTQEEPQSPLWRAGQ
jgi:hypothetical protein